VAELFDCHVTFAEVGVKGSSEPSDAEYERMRQAVEAMRSTVAAYQPILVHTVGHELCVVHPAGASLIMCLSACSSQAAAMNLAFRSGTNFGPARRAPDAPFGVIGDDFDLGAHLLRELRQPACYLSQKSHDAIPERDRSALVLDRAGTARLLEKRPKTLAMLGGAVWVYSNHEAE